jgi:4-amino-4-deoxy-L-arabinose transferase-like glycosyltransferase
MTPRRTLTLETVVWVGLFGLAAYLRFEGLAHRPLDASEASEALAAAVGTPQQSAFWDSERTMGGTSVLYYVFSHMVFLLGGDGEAGARAIPAAAGLIPLVALWASRRRLGMWAALAAGVLLAVSPSMVAVSRTAGGASLAFAAASLAAALALDVGPGAPWPRRALLGALMGLALLSGPAILTGVVGLLVAVLLLRRRPVSETAGFPMAGWASVEVGQVAAWAAATMLVGATGSGFLWSGVEVFASGVRTWLWSWFQPGSLGLGLAVLLFFAYEPLATVLGTIGGMRSIRGGNSAERFLTVWSLAAVAVFLLRVGRTPDDIMWGMIPLILLAGRLIGREMELADRLQSPLVAAVLSAVILGLAAFAEIQLSAYASGIGPAADLASPGLRLPIAAGAIGLAALLLVLVGLGWDWGVARAGGVGAGVIVLLLMTISATWSLNLSGDPDVELEVWRPAQASSGLHRLRTTIERLAYFDTGTRTMELAVSPSISADVAWAVRGFGTFDADADGANSPPAVLLKEHEPLPRLPAEYLGQGLTTSHQWVWDQAWPSQLLTWILRRTGPKESTGWVLYVREDVATLAQPSEDETP